MFGLAILVVLLVYLLLSIGVVRWAVGYARQNGKLAKKWGWGAALVMYSLVFWDWLPTVAVHQYYCAKDSGFWVYKTLEQWKAENPGVAETLVANKGVPSTRDGDNTNFTNTYLLNQRFNWTSAYHDAIFARLLPVRKIEQTVIDTQTHDVLARYVDFSVGYGNVMLRNDDGLRGFKFWLANKHCIGGEMNDSKLAHFFIAAENINQKAR